MQGAQQDESEPSAAWEDASALTHCLFLLERRQSEQRHIEATGQKKKSKFSLKTLLFISVCVCMCSLGTGNPPGMNSEVCQDIIKPLKHMITILRRTHTLKKEQ